MFNKLAGFNQQKGFTLVEVLTVMLVLIAVASVTIETASTLAFQGRDEITKDRYAKIKAAILGNPAIVVNGQPNISGFVADVGRLPFALQELLDGNFCTDTGYFNSSDCTTNGGAWAPTPNWKGPYISSTQPATGTNALSDGWGNTGLGNYGWFVTFFDAAGNPTTSIAAAANMNIQSLGKDGCISLGGTCSGTEIYDADYPNTAVLPSIRLQDWTANADGITAMIMASSISGTCALSPSPPTDPTICTLTGGSGSPCAGFTVPTSRLGCQSVAGTWTDTPSNLCIKITRSSTVYISEGALPIPTILEDGRNHLVNFTSVYHDANNNFGRDAGETSYIPIGNISIGIYAPDCVSPITYPAICKNTLSHANFTQSNCVANGGQWSDSINVIDRSCINIPMNTSGTLCTGTTSPQLGGTWVNKPLIQLSISPNTTLPTINW